MKNIKHISAIFFIIATAVLSVVSILGVWKIFGNDVIWKSFETLSLLAVLSAVTMIAGNFIESKNQSVEVIPEAPHPVFKMIRRSTLAILIVSVSVLAFLGVLAIWDVTPKDVLYKSLSSVCVLAFSTLIIVATCLEMEGVNKNIGQNGKNVSFGNIAGAIVLFYILLMIFGRSIFGF